MTRRMRNKLTISNLEYYFAYGSNMDEHKLKIKRRINFYEKFSGKIDGWEILFDKAASGKPGVAYSNISPKENSCVEGIVYKIKSEDILNKLDKREGWPEHYEKKYMSVKTTNGFWNAWCTLQTQTRHNRDCIQRENILMRFLQARNSCLIRTTLS